MMSHRSVSLGRWLGLLLGALAFVAPAVALDRPAPPAPVTTEASVIERVTAHPALWVAHGRHGTVYLLGSIHILPPALDWRSPEIAHAIDTADVFAFEIPSDQSAMDGLKTLMQQRGYLLPGESLRAMLSDDGKANLDKALAISHLPLAAVDKMRPWLAMLTISVVRIMTQNKATAEAGLDKVLADEAAAKHKELRYLETVEEQLDFLAPKDETLQLEAFESGLKKFTDQSDEYDLTSLLDSWATGDTKKLDDYFNASMAKYPKARRLLIDDRNRNWIRVIRPMLDNEDKTFLITVGAGHLVGRHGVPNLLRAAGYKVDGPR
jgi:uncharacterized protein YbaP (TraB family)